jgi:hypothetical protein
MTHSDALDQIAPALALAQAVFTAPKRTHEVKTEKFSYKFAPLDEVVNVLRKPLGESGLSFVQTVETFETPIGMMIGVSTTILHASGQWIENGMVRLPAGATAQQYGSAESFGRRYSLIAAFGLAAEDDSDAVSVEATTPSQPTTTKTAEVVGGLRVTGVTEKAGTSKQGKPYIAYTITFSDGRKASTFDVTLKDAATSFWKNTTPCEAVLTEKNGYLNLMELNIVRELADPNLGF